MVTITELHKYGRTKFIMPGTAACPGCPLQVGMRQLAMALDGKFVMVIPAGCSSVIPGSAPYTAYTVPVLHVPFASSPAVASGLVRAVRQRGINGPVVVWAGDGATADIGFATLSGAAYRNEDILYVMADNEAYMNTGIQASGTTSWMAWTTTSPRGKTEDRKDVALIMLMHKVPYVATASIATQWTSLTRLGGRCRSKALGSYTSMRHAHQAGRWMIHTQLGRLGSLLRPVPGFYGSITRAS